MRPHEEVSFVLLPAGLAVGLAAARPRDLRAVTLGRYDGNSRRFAPSGAQSPLEHARHRQWVPRSPPHGRRRLGRNITLAGLFSETGVCAAPHTGKPLSNGNVASAPGFRAADADFWTTRPAN